MKLGYRLRADAQNFVEVTLERHYIVAVKADGAFGNPVQYEGVVSELSVSHSIQSETCMPFVRLKVEIQQR